MSLSALTAVERVPVDTILSSRIAGVETGVKIFNFTDQTIKITGAGLTTIEIPPEPHLEHAGSIVIITTMSWKRSTNVVVGKLFKTALDGLSDAEQDMVSKITEEIRNGKENKTVTRSFLIKSNTLAAYGGTVLVPEMHLVVSDIEACDNLCFVSETNKRTTVSTSQTVDVFSDVLVTIEGMPSGLSVYVRIPTTGDIIPARTVSGKGTSLKYTVCGTLTMHATGTEVIYGNTRNDCYSSHMILANHDEQVDALVSGGIARNALDAGAIDKQRRLAEIAIGENISKVNSNIEIGIEKVTHAEEIGRVKVQQAEESLAHEKRTNTVKLGATVVNTVLKHV